MISLLLLSLLSCKGSVVCHYLVDRLNYYFSDDNPIAYVVPSDLTTNQYTLSAQYNTPVLSQVDERWASRDDFIFIVPEGLVGTISSFKRVVRWIMFFLVNDFESYQFKPNDEYIACYSQGICTQFDDHWHKHPLRVIDLNWDVLDPVLDTNRVRDIDVVYFKPDSRKRTWIDSRGIKSNLDFDSYEYILTSSYELMNKTLVRMDPSLGKRERLELLSRSNTFISLDPATFRSVEAAMVGCLSIVIPVSGVSKSEWLSVSYAPEYLQYGIAYGFDDLNHARATINLVLSNLHEQDKKTKEILVKFIIDIKRYFNLHPDFLKDKLYI